MAVGLRSQGRRLVLGNRQVGGLVLWEIVEVVFVWFYWRFGPFVVVQVGAVRGLSLLVRDRLTHCRGLSLVLAGD